ncbi:MAG: DUF4142 domain-containing protein [Acidobacteriota bacterium]
MKMQVFILSAALAAFIPLAAQASQPPANPSSTSAAHLSNHDRLFLHTLASEDQSEINLAKLALQKSKNAQVQQYAKSKILAADPAMKQGAVQLAAQHHTAISSSPNQVQKAEYANLSNLAGSSFDRAYARYEGKQQAEDLIVVQDETHSAKDPQVGSYAQREVTPVQQAAQAAKQMANSMGTHPHP